MHKAAPSLFHHQEKPMFLPSIQELYNHNLLSLHEAIVLDEGARRSPEEFLSLPKHLLRKLLNAQQLMEFDQSKAVMH